MSKGELTDTERWLEGRISKIEEKFMWYDDNQFKIYKDLGQIKEDIKFIISKLKNLT